MDKALTAVGNVLTSVGKLDYSQGMVKSLLENYGLLLNYQAIEIVDLQDKRAMELRAPFENPVIYKADLEAAISKLDKRSQKMIDLHYIQGYDLSEIAKTSGLLIEELQAIFSRIIRRIVGILNFSYPHRRRGFCHL